MGLGHNGTGTLCDLGDTETKPQWNWDTIGIYYILHTILGHSGTGTQ